MELYNKFKSQKNKYYSKAFSNSTTSIKNINNDSFKYVNQFSPKINNQKNNLNKAFPIQYNYQKYRNEQKYIKSKYDSKSYNHISLKKNNIIKINLKPKSKSKDKNKTQSTNIRYNNKSLLLSERIKNKSLNILSGFNSDNKIKEKTNNYINNNENGNLFLNNNKFDLTNKILSPKTTRKNNNSNHIDFDFEKNIEYFKDLQNKIKELQNKIEKTKKSLYINEKNISSNKNEEKKSFSKIDDLSLLNKKINKNKNNNKNESKKNSLNNSINNNSNNSNIKKGKKIDFNKNESKKTQSNSNSNNNIYTILNYNSKHRHNINHNFGKKKTYIMKAFNKNLFNNDKHLNLPIKSKNKSKSKN